MLLKCDCIFGISNNRIVVSKDGKGDFNTVQAAINSVPDNQSVRTIIFVKKGIYFEKVLVSATKKNITLIGEDKEQTIITYNDYSSKVVGNETIGTTTSYTFAVDGDGFTGINLTFENSSGRVGQAVAVRIMSDKVIFENCRFLGNQDTIYTKGLGRIYFKRCYIEGTTDFIFGSSVALFEECNIHSKINSYITAASTPQEQLYGYVFKNCVLTSDTGVTSVFLGRPWRPYARTVYLECTMGAHICPKGWDNWRNPDKEKTVYYAEYKSKGLGADTSERVPWCRILTDSEASEYTMAKIFADKDTSASETKWWIPNIDIK